MLHNAGRDQKENGGACADEKPSFEPKSRSKEGKNPGLAAAGSGALDLTLLDFTSSKFPLISKVVSEKSPRKANVGGAATAEKNGDKGLTIAVCTFIFYCFL